MPVNGPLIHRSWLRIVQIAYLYATLVPIDPHDGTRFLRNHHFHKWHAIGSVLAKSTGCDGSPERKGWQLCPQARHDARCLAYHAAVLPYEISPMRRHSASVAKTMRSTSLVMALRM